MTLQDTSTRLTLAVCLAVLLAAVAPGVAVAQSDEEEDSILDSALGTVDSLGEELSAVSSWASGARENAAYRVFGPDTERTPSECANAIQTEINDHNSTYEQYASSRLSASEDRDVVAIRCALEADDGEVKTDQVYLVTDVNSSSGSYENARVVDSTDRQVDHVIRLSGLATAEMPDDLVAFREDYASEDKTPGGAYKREMAGKYAGSVHGTFEFLPDMEDS